MLTNIKSKIKKQKSTANKNTLYRKLQKKYDLVDEMNKMIEINYNKKIEKLREDFKNNSQDFDLLYPIVKLTDPNLDNLSPNTKEKEKDILISEIFEQIKKHNSFFYFLSYYHINDNILTKIIPSLKYEFYEKNTYIYKENDFSTKIYFIIKGSVSFRKKEKIIINESTSKIEEVENYILGENKYFGELDLIYDRRKIFSAFCSLDSHILIITRDIFKKFIEDKMSRIEIDKKLFLISFFNKFVNMPSIKLERFILNNIKTLFYRRNEIIYKEGDKNIYLYIIYCGEAILINNIKEKEFSYIIKYNESIKYILKKASQLNYPNIVNNIKINSEKEKNNEIMKLDILLNKTKYNIIANLIKGSIGGLEITTGIQKLKYSLISNSDFTCVLKVDLRNIDDYLNILMLNLLPIFIKLEKNINKRINNIKLIDDNVLPLSCQKFKKCKSDYFNEEEEENDKVYKRNIQKINDSFQLNKGGFIKMNEYNLNIYKQKNYFEDMLKKNHKNNYKIKTFIKNLEKEKHLNLKCSELKMSKSNLNLKNNFNKKLKSSDSSSKIENNMKLKNLNLDDINLNNNNNFYSNIQNNHFINSKLSKNEKNTLSEIKNINHKKRKLNWDKLKTELISNKIKNMKLKNQSNLNQFKIKSNFSNKNIKTKNDLLYTKLTLSINDNNYIKNLLIYKGPDKGNKNKEFLCLTPKNIKTTNTFNNKEKNNQSNNEDKKTISHNIQKK